MASHAQISVRGMSGAAGEVWWVQLQCHDGIRAQKLHAVWFWALNSMMAL